MKNNIDFYQHYAGSDQHPKFKMLRVEYGWEGEGKFWALNNRIAQADECCLNISKKYNKAAIANDLDFNLETFDMFIEFLKIDCELIRECKPGIITTDIIQENFEKVSGKRKKNQSYYKKAVSDTLSNSQTTGTEIQQAETIQSKVKESKVKESKDKGKNENKPPLPPKAKKEKKKFDPPAKEDVVKYFIENEYDGNKGAEAFEFYDCADWFDSRGNKVKNWKQKMRGVWFKDDNKVRANGKQNGFMSVSEQNTQTCKEWINGE
jgi:hypothetical protein